MRGRATEAAEAFGLLQDIRACRKEPETIETIHGSALDIGPSWSISGLTSLLPRIEALLAKGPSSQVDRDTARLDFLHSELCDLRWISGGEDGVGIRIVSHHMKAPTERIEAENWHEDLRGAIDEAMAALNPSDHLKLAATTNTNRDAVIEECAKLVENWNGETRDGDTANIAHAIRALKGDR